MKKQRKSKLPIVLMMLSMGISVICLLAAAKVRNEAIERVNEIREETQNTSLALVECLAHLRTRHPAKRK